MVRDRDTENTEVRPPRFSSSGRSAAYAPAPNSDRHASWLELFFDLVFVFAVAELGFLFVPVWRVWMALSNHAEVFVLPPAVVAIGAALLLAGLVAFELRHPPRIRYG